MPVCLRVAGAIVLWRVVLELQPLLHLLLLLSVLISWVLCTSTLLLLTDDVEVMTRRKVSSARPRYGRHGCRVLLLLLGVDV